MVEEVLSRLFDLVEEVVSRSWRSCWRRSFVSSASSSSSEEESDRDRFFGMGFVDASVLLERRAAGFFLGLRNILREK